MRNAMSMSVVILKSCALDEKCNVNVNGGSEESCIR